ncbi:hypothetical protein [Pseudomonas sp. Irchel 3E13]|uniref:hypothetical protein n=1 Tax=Pseudomonas sp. Irchel 3E13 TaxID=2008975 RepID=UPI00135CA69A|nr:hypothetical protein [Pseudomonas sp. Irchel 3E13]
MTAEWLKPISAVPTGCVKHFQANHLRVNTRPPGVESANLTAWQNRLNVCIREAT